MKLNIILSFFSILFFYYGCISIVNEKISLRGVTVYLEDTPLLYWIILGGVFIVSIYFIFLAWFKSEDKS